MNEMDIAKAIASGQLSSPQQIGNLTLYAIRITGTNVTWRGDWGKFVYRNPKLYLCPEFLARCNGLEVVFEHPVTQDKFLDTEEYRDRSIGSVFYPYIFNDEVWGIARIRDSDAVLAMQNGYIKSTSPAITVKKGVDTEVNGNPIHSEGMPIYIDHIAVLSGVGVWDKSSVNASGILNGKHVMADQPEIEDNKPEMDAPPPEPTPVPAAAPAPSNDGDTIKTMLDLLTRMDARLEKQEAELAALKSAEATEPAHQFDEIAAKVADVQANMPANLDDKEKDDIAELEMKAVDACAALGIKALRATGRDTLKDYKKRVLRALQPYSPAFKDVSVDALFADEGLLKTADAQIFTDAFNAAKNPVALAGEIVRPVTETKNGRTVTKYIGGDHATFLNNFKLNPRPVQRFTSNTNGAMH